MKPFVYSRQAVTHPRRGAAAFAIAATVWAGLPATGQADPSWSSTFPPSAVEQRVGAATGAVVVVGVGEPSTTLGGAADAVAGALQRSGATVTRADDVQTDDDVALARDQAAASKAARVLVVRVFDEGEDDVESVVTVYDADGNVLDAFTGEPGRPIAATGNATAGVGAEAAEAAIDATGEAEAAHEEAQSAYDRDFVGFEDVYYAQASGSTVVVGKSIRPYRGSYKEPLTGARFYQHIGRDDLASKYKRRRGARIGLIAGGGVAMLVGVAAGTGLMLKDLGAGDDCFDIDDSFARDMCESDAEAAQSRNLRNGGILMGVLGGGGLVAMFTGFFIKPHPVDASQARRLADEYNEDLRERVGLSEAGNRDQAKRPSVDVRPTASRTGAGLVVQGRF